MGEDVTNASEVVSIFVSNIVADIEGILLVGSVGEFDRLVLIPLCTDWQYGSIDTVFILCQCRIWYNGVDVNAMIRRLVL